VPVFDRTHEEPFVNTAPCVMMDGGRWRAWYVCGLEWVHRDLPRYHIRHAESADGVRWERPGRVCIDLRPGEHALARPCVVKEDGLYRMWFAHKGARYRLGYAESPDGMSWTRNDEQAGLEVSDAGWDSQMIEYAFLHRHAGTGYLFYNGNDYGRDGIGLAVSGPDRGRA
jgi:hypothetical protein